MKAKSKGKDEPDVVEAVVSVPDATAAKSRILDLIGQLVEPGIEGIYTREIEESPGSKSGFVVVFIPPSDGPPRRSRKDWKFYLRIGSGTFPMEYFQIADMFGQRVRPNLTLYLAHETIGVIPYDQRLYQILFLGLSNTGRGIAKFPSVRFKYDQGFRVHPIGIDGNGAPAFPQRPSDSEWIVFRGGVDDVIFPEDTLKIARICRLNSGKDYTNKYIFPNVTFAAEISCEGMRTRKVECDIAMRSING